MKKLLIATAVAVTFSGAAFADNTSTGDVNVEGAIIDTLTIRDADITMPDLVKPDGAIPESNTTVKLACDQNGTGTVSYTNNGNPFANGVAASAGVMPNSRNAANSIFNATGACGDATVTGQAGAAYNISVDISGATPNNGVTLLAVDCLSQSGNSAASGVIASAGATPGEDHIWCGAEVEADGSAWVSYAVAGSITVTYD